MNLNLIIYMSGITFFAFLLTQLNKNWIIDLTGKLELNPDVPITNRLESSITGLIFHHSAGSPDETIADVLRYHVHVKNWSTIGYTYIIYPDGTTYKVNEHTTVAPHVRWHNRKNLGVCLLGNFTQYEVPELQMKAAFKLAKRLKRIIPSLESLGGHNDYAATKCPAYDVQPIADYCGLDRYVKKA